MWTWRPTIPVVDKTGGVRRAEIGGADRVPAPVLVLGGIASVQFGAAIATKLFPTVGPGGAVFLRLVFSALLLIALSRPDVRAIPRPHLRLAVLFGIVLAGMNLLFYLSLNRIPLGVAVTVEFLGPLAVAVAGSRRAIDLLWVVLAATGVALLSSAGGSLDVVGIVLAASAGACWAGYILLSQRVGRAIEGMTGLTIALSIGAIGMAPYGIIDGGRSLLHASIIGKGAAIAVLSSAVPYSLELAALRRLKASVFGVLMSLEPAMAALSGLILLSQHLRPREWIAVGCVMIASVGATSQTEVEVVT
jgi:inner membrane transporter RhtA